MNCFFTKTKCLISTFVLFLFIGTSMSLAQETNASIPQLVSKNGRYALMVDGQPFLMLGAQCGNSSAWPKMMPNVWNTLKSMHANTLEIPIYWEQFEPQQGQYDYSMIQLLLNQARQNDMRLVLLWFGTWKNGSNHYMPAWMKQDAKKYPNIIGKDGQPVDSPSPHAKATLEADKRAFTEFMSYLKKADACHTVLMVQVENEPGAWNSVRDYSATAQKLFEQPVPKALLTANVLKQLNVSTKAKGTWSQVFGERADEYFHAWSVASFIEEVAAAGKAVNPLPLYVNVALRDPLTNPMATEYESGGPTDNVISIWKVAAPHIDLLAPDIYLQGDEKVLKVIDLYARPDNALMVPETGRAEKYLYKVIEKGFCFAPFGVDARWGKQEMKNPLADEYKLLVPMSRELAKWSFEGSIRSVVEPESHADQVIDLGNWQAVVKFGTLRYGPIQKNSSEAPATGKAMMVILGENEFFAIGTNCRFTFNATGKNKGKAWQYLKVEEGTFEDGVFQPTRILNGDQTDFGGPSTGEAPILLRISLVAR